MIALRAAGTDYCTGTPDNPCWVDEMAIDVKLPSTPSAKPSRAPLIAGVALSVVTVGVLVAAIKAAG